MLPENIKIFPGIRSLSEYACTKITDIANLAIQERQRFRIVLSGGSTPTQIYKLLADSHQNWQNWEIFWGDERCLPADHADRNSFSATENWLDRVNIPRKQIHPIPAELGAEKAAWLYQKTIMDKTPFDLVLLGMGEDGHTASLFPNNPAGDQSVDVVPVTHAPKPPAERVSLNFSVLKNTLHQMILAAGAGKADALYDWQTGKRLPVADVCIRQTILLLDEAAAARLSVAD